ncbi:hypothetical protein J2805_000734 [Arthrobacter oryzae]|nr:hypothetical protein [Arthrobacter oryzae]
MVDAQHDPDPTYGRTRHHQNLPVRTIQSQRRTHQFPARLLEASEPIDGLNEPDVVLEVGRRLNPAVPAARGDSHLPEVRQRRYPLTKGGAQGGQVRYAIGTDEAARRQQTGDYENVDLAGVVKHQVRLVDRGEPVCRRAHGKRLAAGSAST